MPRRKRAVWRQRHIELAAHGNHFALVFAIQQVVAALHARERGPAVLERHVLQIVQLVGLYTTNILLAQNDRDAGSASAPINFSVNIFGVVGMGLVSLFSVRDYAFGLGALLLASMITIALLWAYLLTSKKAHIKELES